LVLSDPLDGKKHVGEVVAVVLLKRSTILIDGIDLRDLNYAA
jgi:hypothetical protein